MQRYKGWEEASSAQRGVSGESLPGKGDRCAKASRGREI